ncbi:hypothetical protein [Pelagicoccus sp. SDUM812002]|uniref:hypothetical protein n=1 Tax=Pelagicoccus sp. SDUM812002 TaxID=3041266 RepID=UPI0028104BA9|nr:hypothetical protein [Pelagicoccus sp. SDUM812002]MDQ8187811.1 hypothetical protein [Pelagicoccus sp. SDUM812002]
MKQKSSLYLSALIIYFAFLTGCSTAGLGEGKEVTGAILDVTKGSSTADLVAALGEPISIEPYEPDPNVEIWTYDFTKSRVDMVGVDTQEIPYVDPITGIERTITEAVYRPQTTTEKRLVRVFVAKDTVIGWKEETDVDRDLVR